MDREQIKDIIAQWTSRRGSDPVELSTFETYLCGKLKSYPRAVRLEIEEMIWQGFVTLRNRVIYFTQDP